eukprot:CAMPEP_0175045756 /NCGR_PEP_ID=MMETSP0052_2-20121109/4623_1 /TAXON_ID=51329 ORGANISM="Polytomella parva, Strain SAG 63-3" /NCGR_SAMPLE_ID=MMETSP0052_2 /ASSEMBLY_ACC=CAM_ASM_000194 /LENGTH=458 /DNA_ID=CAMNT_0016309369 /DNA_START=215 /DNA_END=1588 /DNA_ORIENTATION=+
MEMHRRRNQDPGFSRNDLLKVMEEALNSLGYQDIASELKSRSGIETENEICGHIRNGSWDKALEVLSSLTQSFEIERRAAFLIFRQKYFEALYDEDASRALQCLRCDLAPFAEFHGETAELSELMLRPKSDVIPWVSRSNRTRRTGQARQREKERGRETTRPRISQKPKSRGAPRRGDGGVGLPAPRDEGLALEISKPLSGFELFRKILSPCPSSVSRVSTSSLSLLSPPHHQHDHHHLPPPPNLPPPPPPPPASLTANRTPLAKAEGRQALLRELETVLGRSLTVRKGQLKDLLTAGQRLRRRDAHVLDVLAGMGGRKNDLTAAAALPPPPPRPPHFSRPPCFCLAMLEGHTDEVWNAAFSDDGLLLASASRDKSVILWQLSYEDIPAFHGVPYAQHIAVPSDVAVVRVRSTPRRTTLAPSDGTAVPAVQREGVDEGRVRDEGGRGEEEEEEGEEGE